MVKGAGGGGGLLLRLSAVLILACPQGPFQFSLNPEQPDSTLVVSAGDGCTTGSTGHWCAWSRQCWKVVDNTQDFGTNMSQGYTSAPPDCCSGGEEPVCYVGECCNNSGKQCTNLLERGREILHRRSFLGILPMEDFAPTSPPGQSFALGGWVGGGGGSGTQKSKSLCTKSSPNQYFLLQKGPQNPPV